MNLRNLRVGLVVAALMVALVPGGAALAADGTEVRYRLTATYTIQPLNYPETLITAAGNLQCIENCARAPTAYITHLYFFWPSSGVDCPTVPRSIRGGVIWNDMTYSELWITQVTANLGEHDQQGDQAHDEQGGDLPGYTIGGMVFDTTNRFFQYGQPVRGSLDLPEGCPFGSGQPLSGWISFKR